MIQATVEYPGHATQEQQIVAVPKIGSAIDGPSEGGETWKIAAVVRNGERATISCELVPPPDLIHADISPSALTNAGWICEQ